MKPRRRPPAERRQPGLQVRQAALAILTEILDRRRALSDVLPARLRAAQNDPMDERDAAFIRAMVYTVLRHLGTVDAVLAGWVSKPLPEASGPTRNILRIALTEIGYLRTPAYAAGTIATSLAGADPKARHFRALVNAVVRRAGREAAAALAEQPPNVRLPAWLVSGWERTYGPHKAQAIVEALAAEPPTDLTLRAGAQPSQWAERLGAEILPTGSLRLARAGRIEELPGYADGAWWVQDAAAALPARLLAPAPGQTVYDLCAAPGGKTLQLAAAGAHVTAVDKSAKRLSVVEANLKRAGLSADLVEADAIEWAPERQADALLLDAPCTATGTIRRHPDLPWIKDPGDVRALAEIQRALLLHAADLVKPGGRIVYCVCSLEPQESQDVISQVLAADARLARAPIRPGGVPGLEGFLTPEGTLRTLPSDWPELGGLDGFFAAVLVRT